MRRLAPLLLLLVGGLVIGVLLTEVGYRIGRRWVCVDGTRTAPFVPDPDYGWRHPPGAVHWLHGCVGRRFEWRVRTRINALGLRDREHTYARQPGVRRVLLLGDSMTEALQVPIEAAFATLLEDEVRADGQPVEIINGAIAGFGTDSALLFFGKEGARYAPDLVLLMFNAANDVLENSRALHRRAYEHIPEALPPKPYFHLRADGQLRRDATELHGSHARRGLWDTLRRELYVVRLLARTLHAPPDEPTLLTASTGVYLDVHATPPPPGWVQAWAVTEALLRELARTVERHGARLVVGLIPTKREVSAGEPGKREPRGRGGIWDFDRPTREIAVILERQGIPYVSLRPALRAHVVASKSTGYYERDPHFATAGHRIAADVLRPFLEAALQADDDGFDASIVMSEAARSVDIVGMQLGMTPDEIQTAIADHDASLEVHRSDSNVALADGTQRSFTTSVRAERRVTDPDAIDVTFSQPPREAQAVGIIRREGFVAGSRPAYATVRQALLDQYGPPTDELVRSAVRGEAVDLERQGGGIRLTWRLDEHKIACVQLRQGKRAPRPSTLGGHAPAECSALLVAWIGIRKGVVTAVTTALSDPALSAVAQSEYRAFHRTQREARIRRQREP